jgi:purine nucleosidase
MGLDASHQVLAGAERVQGIRAVGNAAAEATAGMLEFFSRHDSEKYGADGAPLHDPCTIAWLLRPELFDGKACNVAVECGSELTMGHTSVDFWGVSGRDVNVNWIHRVDADGFYTLLTERLAAY